MSKAFGPESGSLTTQPTRPDNLDGIHVNVVVLSPFSFMTTFHLGQKFHIHQNFHFHEKFDFHPKFDFQPKFHLPKNVLFSFTNFGQ
jgi:hypothetical protein